MFDAKEIERRWQSDFAARGTFIPYGAELDLIDLPLEPGLEHRKYVLAVARLVPENSIPEFFEAAKEISKRAKVVIVGSTGYGGELDEYARALSGSSRNVIWLGHLNDDRRLFSLWQHAGVYFHGHSVGGTNPALVQAMALGSPIVARNTPYNREVLGNSAPFVEPQPDAITKGVLDLLNQPGEMSRQSSKNRLRAKEHYSWASINSDYEHALRVLSGLASDGNVVSGEHK